MIASISCYTIALSPMFGMTKYRSRPVFRQTQCLACFSKSIICAYCFSFLCTACAKCIVTYYFMIYKNQASPEDLEHEIKYKKII